MTTEPAFYVGALLLVTGVACLAIGMILGRRYALVVAGGIPFLVGGALLVHIARERHRFRVTEVTMRPLADYAGRCPAERRVGVRVRTAGGAGEVRFRVWAGDDYDAAEQRVRVPANVGFEHLAPVAVADDGLVTAYASVEHPNVKTTSKVFRVTCTAGG